MMSIGDHALLGSFVCPSDDGDFTVSVYDLENWFTGACLIRQEGQGQTNDIVVCQDEAEQLADILTTFSKMKYRK